MTKIGEQELIKLAILLAIVVFILGYHVGKRRGRWQK
jgi:hypothetical protein